MMSNQQPTKQSLTQINEQDIQNQFAVSSSDCIEVRMLKTQVQAQINEIACLKRNFEIERQKLKQENQNLQKLVARNAAIFLNCSNDFRKDKRRSNEKYDKLLKEKVEIEEKLQVLEAAAAAAENK